MRTNRSENDVQNAQIDWGIVYRQPRRAAARLRARNRIFYHLARNRKFTPTFQTLRDASTRLLRLVYKQRRRRAETSFEEHRSTQSLVLRTTADPIRLPAHIRCAVFSV